MSLEITPLKAQDLDEADRIFRLAFGTFLGLPDPLKFAYGMEHVRSRYGAAPENWIGAYQDGKLVGSNCVTLWGKFGFFGPLTVHPEKWDSGIARHLLNQSERLFDQAGVEARALFTFPHSPKHLALYQKYDYWAGGLTPVMSRPVSLERSEESDYLCFSQQPREKALASCRAICQELMPGLDLTPEILSVAEQGLGETLYKPGGGLAICHTGAGTEAGQDACYIKFGFCFPGGIEPYLKAVESLACSKNLTNLVIGCNMECHDAYRFLVQNGFRSMMVGVAMNSGGRAALFGREKWVFCDLR